MKVHIPPAARWLAILCLLAAPAFAATQASAPQQQDPAAVAIIQQVADRELTAYRHHQNYFYLSEERSDRTNQHLWLEAVVETPHGKLRRLLKEDGQPLSPQRRQQEDARIAALAADPAKLDASTRALEQDEEHAHALFNSPAGLYLYSLDTSPAADGLLKINFRPNPTYQAPSYELRVLHALAGSILVERDSLRLRQIDAKIVEDVKFGWGILGEIQPGGELHMVRALATGDDYKPVLLDLHMQGHMLLFHTLSRAQHLTHRGFIVLPANLPLAEAGKMVLAATP
jgi:hypothetical protein